MKKSILLCMLFIYSFCSYSQTDTVVTTEGSFYIDVGGGFSPSFDGFHANSPYISFNGSTPLISFTADYGILNTISIGAAFSYQSAKVYYTPSRYSTSGLNYISRSNYAVRLLVNLNKKHMDKLDFYAGIRLGGSYLTDYVQDANPATIYYLNYEFSWVFSFQALLGIHIYPTYHFGIQAELGIGPPYLVEAGIAVRLGKH